MLVHTVTYGLKWYNKNMAIKTLKVRVKDKHAKVLRAMSVEANQVWNYANDLSYRMIKERGKWMTGFDFWPYVAGASYEFQHATSGIIQAVCEEFVNKRIAAKKYRLGWRKSFGSRRSLGWIPFKAAGIKYKGGQIRLAGHYFNVWDSYGLGDYKFKAGCFTEDARGRWYFCVAVASETVKSKGAQAVGVDLGLKDIATCSDGTRLENAQWYRDQEESLAVAQRAKNKVRVRAIHAKIANRRKDALHKFSRQLVNRSNHIVVGDVSSSKLVKTNMAKSVLDAGWFSLKTMLKYKCENADIIYSEVNEAYTTVTCSACGSSSGPSGPKGLRVREWRCCECGSLHDRDVNSAINILHLGVGHGPLAVGTLSV